jgi:hypothetical protein
MKSSIVAFHLLSEFYSVIDLCLICWLMPCSLCETRGLISLGFDTSIVFIGASAPASALGNRSSLDLVVNTCVLKHIFFLC